MNRRYVNSKGFFTRLDCPSCGRPCKTMLPFRATSEIPFPHWEDGDTCECQCGAKLIVKADGERAWLREENAE